MSQEYSGPPIKANDEQVGGEHYKTGGEEHWDRAWRLEYDCFQYIITKWVERWRKKGGVQDLRKAQHAIAKYIEVVENIKDSPGYAKLDTLDEIMYKERPSRAIPTPEELLDIMPNTKFTYEGGTATSDIWTCKDCRGQVVMAKDGIPGKVHDCRKYEEPTKAYVNQGE